MGAIISIFTSRLAGPIASAAALALAISLAFTWISAKATEHSLRGQVASLQTQIDDPRTGWRARLDQCQAQQANLQANLDSQNAQVTSWKAEAAAASARAEAAEVTARLARGQAEKSASATLALKPGPDHCASALDLMRSSQ